MKVPFLTGESDLDQLSKIFETLGTPSDDDWPVRCHRDVEVWWVV